MPELKVEYPKGQRSLERVLVEMLKEKRSWNDLTEIGNALDIVRRSAKAMQDEQRALASTAVAGNCSEAPERTI
jgi:hypothetical protein